MAMGKCNVAYPIAPRKKVGRAGVYWRAQTRLNIFKLGGNGACQVIVFNVVLAKPLQFSN